MANISAAATSTESRPKPKLKPNRGIEADSEIDSEIEKHNKAARSRRLLHYLQHTFGRRAGSGIAPAAVTLIVIVIAIVTVTVTVTVTVSVTVTAQVYRSLTLFLADERGRRFGKADKPNYSCRQAQPTRTDTRILPAQTQAHTHSTSHSHTHCPHAVMRSPAMVAS